MADINDLKNRTVSHGTLNPDHLIPAFCDVLKEYAPDKYAEFIKGYPELDGWEEFLREDWRLVSDDTKMDASDELFGLLNDIAPEGTMFSSTEGDGSDFGFWTVEEKLLDDDEGEKALKQMAKDGKSTGEVAADIRYDVATALDMAADKAEDLMTKFGLDKIYVLRAQGLSPKAIAKKILKACESKDEGWLGGFYSRQDVLDAMDGGILNKDWKLEKRFGNWGCYVNQDTGRPLVLQVMVSQDRNGDWGYKPVTSDMGPVDTNIQAAKWLKPRLEEWVEKNPDLAKDVPDYEWGWIEKCLGKETANKDRKNLVSSLVKGDKIKLIDTVADGAVVTFIDMITPTKMRILHNGREMSCKTSFIDRKVEESKSEAKKYYGYGKDDAIDKEDNDFMWQVAYDWFVDKLPEKLTQYADKAVLDVIDKDSRTYEEIVTMDDYYDYLKTYGPAVIEEITGDHLAESKKTESSGADLASIYGDGDVSTHENSADGFYVDERDPMGFAVLNNDTATMEELFSGKAVAPEKPWTYAGWHEDTDAPENKDGSYPYVYDWEREYDLNFVNDWKRVVGDKDNEKALELLLKYAPDFIPSAMDFWNAFHAGYSKGLLRKLFDNIFAVVDKDDPYNNYLGYGDYTYDEVAKFLDGKDESRKSDGEDEEAFGKFEDAVKSILMDKYGVVDSHGPSDETANSLVLQYGATLRDAFDKGGEYGYDPTSVALLIITRQLREAPQFFDDCKDFTFNKDSKKFEAKYDRPVTLYATTRFADAEEARRFIRSITNDNISVSTERNGDTVSVSIEGSDEDIDAFLEVYTDNYVFLESDCDVDVMGWTSPDDLKYYTVQGRKELMSESKNEDLNTAKDFVSSIAPIAILVRQASQPGFKGVKNSDDHIIVGFMRHDNTRFIIDWDADKKQGTATRQVPVDDKDALYGYKWVTPKTNANVTFTTREELKDFVEGSWDNTSSESKNESLTLKQKELKDMARYGEAEDITTISDAEAKELKKKGIETVGVSRGTYGMNGALLRDREGNKYVITARSSNLFYFV